MIRQLGFSNSNSKLHLCGKRTFLFMRRLLNKPMTKSDSPIKNFYSEKEYIKIAKEFRHASRTLLPNSMEYKQIRNEFYKKLRETEKLKKSEEEKEKFEVNHEQYFINVMASHEDPSSYQIVNLMNYNDLYFYTTLRDTQRPDQIILSKIRKESQVCLF